jgi:hypothetical protein
MATEHTITTGARRRGTHQEKGIHSYRYGIRVNQVQDKAKAKGEIYKQNPKLRGHVEILRLAWKKKLLRSGRISDLSILALQNQSRPTSSLTAA